MRSYIVLLSFVSSLLRFKSATATQVLLMISYGSTSSRGRVRRAQVKFLSLVLLSTLLPASSPIASVQQDQAGIAMSGRVSAGVSLSVSKVEAGAGATATIESKGADFADIRIEGKGYGGGAAIAVPLEIRTNVGYEVRYCLLETEGNAPSIRASVESVRESGRWVLPRAAEEATRQPVGLARLNSPAKLLAGPRVSARGALTSPSNALLVVVKFHYEPCKNKECGRKARVRLSLHPNGNG